MSLLPGQLACFQSHAAALRTDVCTITEPGAQTIGAGGGVVAGTPVSTPNVVCRIESVSDGGDVYEIASRLQLKAPMVFYFATTQAVSDDAEITSGGFRYKTKWVKPVTALTVEKTVLVDKVS
jgi:hypothetical protein